MPRPSGAVLILTDQPLVGALLGMLVELADFAPAFAEPGERPEDAVSRVRPLYVILVDGALEAARSDLFFAHAARRQVGVAIFGSPGAVPDIAPHAHARGVPAFEVPTDVSRLEEVLAAAAVSDWWRSSPDRRRRPQVEHTPDGGVVYLDRTGRRWRVYDRRTGERRAEARDGNEIARLFVGDDGEMRRCPMSPEEARDHSPDELERQFARAERV